MVAGTLMNIYWQSFATFFRVGLFTLGGGYAMIPLIQTEVVDRHKWVSKEEFLDLIAIAQSCPGVFAANISIFIGYKLRKVPGAIVTCLGTCLPSFIIILLIAMFFRQFQDALIAVPTFNLAKSAKITWSTCWIPIVCALAIWLLGVSPILVILLAAIGGYVYGTLIKPTE